MLTRHLLPCAAFLASFSPFAAVPAQGYDLQPGDIVIAESPPPYTSGTLFGYVRILHANGAVDTIAAGWPFYGPSDVILDRDGAVLVSNFQDAGGVLNGIYRIDPGNGTLSLLNTMPLFDNFTFLRDGAGDLVVADGIFGLSKIDVFGGVRTFSPPTATTFMSLGLALDYNGELIASEASYAVGGPAGSLYFVDFQGQRRLFTHDPVNLPNPTNMALDYDGAVLVADAWQSSLPPRHGIVRADRGGATQTLSSAGLSYPRDVEVVAPGYLAIAEPGLESVGLRKPSGSLVKLVSEFDDGDPLNGKPVDRPFGLAVVPWLWLTTPMSVRPGATVELRLQAPLFLAGEKVQLAISLERGPTPLSLIWPGDPQSSHVGLQTATFLEGRIDPHGEAVFTVTVPNDPTLFGKAYHVQGAMASQRLLSNYFAVPVR